MVRAGCGGERQIIQEERVDMYASMTGPTEENTKHGEEGEKVLSVGG